MGIHHQQNLNQLLTSIPRSNSLTRQHFYQIQTLSSQSHPTPKQWRAKELVKRPETRSRESSPLSQRQQPQSVPQPIQVQREDQRSLLPPRLRVSSRKSRGLLPTTQQRRLPVPRRSRVMMVLSQRLRSWPPRRNK